MTIDLNAASTVLGLVNSTVTTVKNVVELAKSSKDSTLKEAISEVLDGVLEIKSTILDLEEQNRELKRQITNRQEIKRDGTFGYWFKQGESDPLCPKCYEGSDQIIYLTSPKPWNGGTRRLCRVCSTFYQEEPMKSNSTSIRNRPNPLRGYL